MYRALKLERLLIYSDIYGLGLTDKDVSHLQTVFTAYKQQIDMEYIYRAATTGYDLLLEFSSTSMEPYLNLERHNQILDKIGYPAMKIGEIYLKFLPQIADLRFLKEAGNFIPRHWEDRHAPNLVFNNINEIKKQILEEELPHYDPDYYHPLDVDKINMLYKSANKVPPTLNIKKADYADVPPYIFHIVEVLQLPDDTRVAFFVGRRRANNYYYSNAIELEIQHYITKVGEPAYNWTDPGRYFSHPDEDTDQPRVFYTDSNPVFPKDKDVIDNFRRGQKVLTIDNATLDTLVKRWMRKQQDLVNEQAAIKALEKKIKDKIDELNSGGEFSYNDVTFRKNEFEYEGQVLSCPAIDTKILLEKFAGHYSEDHLNFDRILDVWLSELYRTVTKSSTPVIGNIGDVQFTIEHTKRTAKNGVVAHTYRVNDHRINKDEVQQVLGRAICFPDTATFDEFCETVASCSLRYHKFLAGGIIVNVHDEIFNQKMEFKISLERHKNKNFIVFNGKKFKVGDTNKLLNILNARGMSRVIDILLDEKVGGMSGDDIKQLMTTGRQLLIEQKKREEDLLKSTMDMFGIEQVEDFKAQNGKSLSGYLIKGSLRNYVVGQKDLLVYEYPSGRYICMVDKGQNEHTNTARLVNRFFALSNDSKLAKEISTL